MPVRYEWDVESLEGEDVLDHDHRDTFAEAIAAEKISQNFRETTRICLVRDIWDYDHGLQERTWAYLEDGKLPEHFEDSGGRMSSRVPQRFHQEISKI